jgi:hypothetical protein
LGGGYFDGRGSFGPDSISVESELEEIDEDNTEPFHPAHNNPYLNTSDYDSRHLYDNNNPHLYPHNLKEILLCLKYVVFLKMLVLKL